MSTAHPDPTPATVRGCPASAEIRNHGDGDPVAWCAHWQGSDGPMRARIYWHTDGRGWMCAETVRDAPDPFRPQPFTCRHCSHVGDRRVHDEARCGERVAAADTHDDTQRGLAEIAANRRFHREQAP